MGLLATKTMVVTPNMMRNLQPSQEYLMMVKIATIEINGQSFGLSRSFGVEDAIRHAIENQESITVNYRESDNLIMNVVRHEKSL
jgi:hypothetical protein